MRSLCYHPHPRRPSHSPDFLSQCMFWLPPKGQEGRPAHIVSHLVTKNEPIQPSCEWTHENIIPTPTKKQLVRQKIRNQRLCLRFLPLHRNRSPRIQRRASFRSRKLDVCAHKRCERSQGSQGGPELRIEDHNKGDVVMSDSGWDLGRKTVVGGM